MVSSAKTLKIGERIPLDKEKISKIAVLIEMNTGDTIEIADALGGAAKSSPR